MTESDTNPPQPDSDEERGRTFDIVVNGEQNEVTGRRHTFEEIVKLAFDDALFSDTIAYTITYKRGPNQNREGTLVPGESVFVTNEMLFNVVRTDKS